MAVAMLALRARVRGRRQARVGCWLAARVARVHPPTARRLAAVAVGRLRVEAYAGRVRLGTWQASLEDAG